MAGTVTVHVRSRIPALTAAANAMAAALTKKAAEDILANAQENVQAKQIIDTGNLFDTLNAQGEGTEWSVHSPAEYSKYCEFGTSKMGARPYMAPAVELVKPSYLAGMKQIIP